MAFGGFMLGIAGTNLGLLKPVRDLLRERVILNDEGPATLATLLGVDPWVVVIALAIAGVVWLLRAPEQRYQGGWSWRRTGLAVGGVGTVAWVASSLTGREYGLSMTEPTFSLFRLLFLGNANAVSWSTFMLLGLPLGAYLAARRSGEFKWRAPSPQRILQALAGGVTMGIGAAIAGGCNIGHGLTGVPLLALSSITATAATTVGVWTGAYFLFGDFALLRALQPAGRA